MDYLTFEDLVLRDEERLPRLDDGAINRPRCQAAIADASNIIRTYLPSLLDADGIAVEPPARIAGTLKVVCRDITLYLLNERPGEEDAVSRYERAIKLLEALAGGGNTIAGQSQTGASAGGIEPMDDDSSAIIDGMCEFLPPKGFCH